MKSKIHIVFDNRKTLFKFLVILFIIVPSNDIVVNIGFITSIQTKLLSVMAMLFKMLEYFFQIGCNVISGIIQLDTIPRKSVKS